MQFNTKLHYGIRAMVEIALSPPNKGIFQKEISQKQEISNKYLDQIIAALKAKGLIRNFKGSKSGYVLNFKAEEISLYDIYTAFEPELKLMDCLSTGFECVRMQQCSIHIFCERVNNQMVNNFKTVSLQNLIDGNIPF